MDTFFHTLPKGRIAEEYRMHDIDDAVVAAQELANRNGKPIYVMAMVRCVLPGAAKPTKRGKPRVIVPNGMDTRL